MAKFTYVSLFSGIGGFEQALNKLGGTCVFASEIDKFAAQAYETLYDEKPAGDITQIEAKDIPDHDLLVGGFPCQAFSVAGKRKGFDDTRGTLFFEIARIAREKQPKALLLENVKGLVNHDKGRTLNVMIETLNEIGYTVDFDVLNSKYFGVPQNRERVFIVAIRNDLIEPEEMKYTVGQTIVQRGKWRISEWARTFNFDFPNSETVYDHYTKTQRNMLLAAERILGDDKASEQRKINARDRIEKLLKEIEEYEHLKPIVTSRLRDILESSVDEKYYLDEEKTAKLVAQLEAKDPNEVRATALQNANMQGRRIKENDEPSFTVSATDRHGVTLSDPQMLGHVDIKGNDAIRRVYAAEGISPTLTTMGGGHREPKNAEQQEPTINVVGNLKPEGSTRHGQRDMVYGDNGLMGALNASDYKQPRPIAQEVRPVLTPDRIEKRQNGRRFKEDGEESFTLTSQDRHGVALGEKPRYRIRKLTPLECFRLQGFPDSAHQALVDAGISDSQRYKQAGNAVTVNVIEAIGERLIPMLS